VRGASVRTALIVRLAFVRQHDDITGLEVRCGVLEEAEVLAGCVVESVAEPGHTTTLRLRGSGHKIAVRGDSTSYVAGRMRKMTLR
jgi:hypothetical protein